MSAQLKEPDSLTPVSSQPPLLQDPRSHVLQVPGINLPGYSELWFQKEYGADRTQLLHNNTFAWSPSTYRPAIIRPLRLSQDKFILLQKWEGTVLEVSADSFFARLVDLTGKGPDEEAEFPLEEVASGDLPLVTPGSVFYWNIGYLDAVGGQRTRVSVIRLRRLPVWSAAEITKVRDNARRTIDLLGWK